ncbi:MAG: hypothetical protein LBM03_01735 [Erysipelotrichaceae bacterium]|jgi:hypothetical protein|nr:hypothetical protein [Erysipelotrichaceae bacterium]
MKKNPELIKISIISGLLIVATFIIYLIGILTFNDITNFPQLYLWTFILISGFCVFSILSLIVLSISLHQKKK